MVQRVHLRRSPAAFILTNEKCKGYHFIGDVMNSNGLRFGIWNCGQVLKQGGPQSVCLALAACCFAKNALPMFWGSRGLEILDWSASGWCQMLPECFPSLSLSIIAIHFHHSFLRFHYHHEWYHRFDFHLRSQHHKSCRHAHWAEALLNGIHWARINPRGAKWDLNKTCILTHINTVKTFWNMPTWHDSWSPRRANSRTLQRALVIFEAVVSNQWKVSWRQGTWVGFEKT